MTYSLNSPDRSISEDRTDVGIWPQLPLFRQMMSAEHSSRFFVVAIFVSMAIHTFLAYLLCVVLADRTAVVGPSVPSIRTPIVVSLVSLPPHTTAPHDGPDSEAVSAVPQTDSIERMAESESVMISKVQGAPETEAPVGKSPAADATPSIKSEAAEHIAQEVIRIPEFEAYLVLTSKGQEIMGPETPAGKIFSTGTTQLTDLEALYGITGELGTMPITESELQDIRFKWRVFYEKRHSSLDVPSAFAGGGLIAVPFFLKDLITGNGYKWFIQEDSERQKDTQARVEFMSDLMDVNDTFKQ